MLRVEKRINSLDWEEFTEVNTGETFRIQNISDDRVRYVDCDSQPDKSVRGNILLPNQVLTFKMKDSRLYMKQNGNQDGFVTVSKAEV